MAESGGWHDRKILIFNHSVDIEVIFAMRLGGSRTNISQRYIHHCNVLNIVSFSENTQHYLSCRIID